MPEIEFVGQSAQDSDNIPANTGRLINLYRDNVGDGKMVLKSVLGMENLASLGGGPASAMGLVDDLIYAVHDFKLWSVNSSGISTNLGAIASVADATISGNNGKVTVCANGDYYVWDGVTLTQPPAGAFSDFGSVTFLGQRTILTERQGRRVQWSAVADPTTLNGLDFATTESRDDDNIRGIALGAELWIFKQRSIERWAQYGTGFSAIPGATVNKGLKAFDLLTRMDEGAFFVGADNKAYIAAPGGSLQPVSTSAVETSLKYDDPQTAFYYQDEGHEFCVITFSARPAWVFDLLTQEWHERAEGESGSWEARHSVIAFGESFVLYDGYGVCKLTRNNLDRANPLYRKAVGRTFAMAGRFFNVPLLQFKARTGVIADPVLTLRTSKDRGITWSGAKTQTLGGLGETRKRIIYRALGQFDDFTPEISISVAADMPIEAIAYLEVS